MLSCITSAFAFLPLLRRKQSNDECQEECDCRDVESVFEAVSVGKARHTPPNVTMKVNVDRMEPAMGAPRLLPAFRNTVFMAV